MTSAEQFDADADRVMQLLAATVVGHDEESARVMADIATDGDAAVFGMCLALASATDVAGPMFGGGPGVAGFDVVDRFTGEQLDPDSLTGDSASFMQATRFLAMHANGDLDGCWALFNALGDLGLTDWALALLALARDVVRADLVEQAAGRPYRQCAECAAPPLAGGAWVPLSFSGEPGPFGGTYTPHALGCGALWAA